MSKKKLYILLIRFPGKGTRVLEKLRGCHYPHTSIGLEEDLNTFYSFVHKGFIVEKVTRYNKPGRIPYPCRLYELEVPQVVYDRVKKRLHRFVETKTDYHYTKLGLVLSTLYIPFKRPRHYFCSHFVAEVLKRTCSAPLSRPCSMYFSSDLEKLSGLKLRYQGDLENLVQRFQLEAPTLPAFASAAPAD